jgi:hypothetical protein
VLVTSIQQISLIMLSRKGKTWGFSLSMNGKLLFLSSFVRLAHISSRAIVQTYVTGVRGSCMGKHRSRNEAILAYNAALDMGLVEII